MYNFFTMQYLHIMVIVTCVSFLIFVLHWGVCLLGHYIWGYIDDLDPKRQNLFIIKSMFNPYRYRSTASSYRSREYWVKDIKNIDVDHCDLNRNDGYNNDYGGLAGDTVMRSLLIYVATPPAICLTVALYPLTLTAILGAFVTKLTRMGRRTQKQLKSHVDNAEIHSVK